MKALESHGAAPSRLMDWQDDQYQETPSMPSPRMVVREVAHMMRSPLGSIILMSETLRERGGDLSPNESRRMLAIIHNAAAGLLLNAGDLLRLAGDSERVAAPAAYSAREALSSVSDVVGPIVELRGCTLTVRVPPDLSLTGDALAVRRAMLAIALRLVRRTSDGEITIGAAPLPRDHVEFFVEAQGEGMRPDDRLEALLEAFRSDHTPEGGFTLSAEGLSLTTAAELVRDMGSELQIESGSPTSLRLSFRVSAG